MEMVCSVSVVILPPWKLKLSVSDQTASTIVKTQTLLAWTLMTTRER